MRSSTSLTILISINPLPPKKLQNYKKLKSHKSSGIDQIINEFFKHSPDKLIPVYAQLFNIILSTGIVPDDWAISIIRPIYKNKGDDTDPNNYRGISLLSCFGKLFTSCLNERLSNFVKAHDTVGPEQAGFKSDQLVHDPTEDLVSYLKLYILMYADDTVLLAESPEDLQKYLDTLNEYCNNFDLKINTSKTKIFIFSRGKLKNIPSFKFADMKLDVVNDYNYLGVTFNFNAKFNVAKQSLYQKGCRAMFALLKRIKSLSPPPDIAFKLFVLYGAEVWGSENCDIVNKVKLGFCKYILHAHKSTCSNMVYGELGETPLHIDIKCKMILYWARLINSKENKLSKLIYSLIYKLYEKDSFHSSWITSVKNILDSAGFSGIWTNQSLPKSPDQIQFSS